MKAGDMDRHLPEGGVGHEGTALAQDFFVAGGTLRFNASSYVKRPADDELFNRALAGEFCYVLTPRQMGKSSLMVRTVHRLRQRGVFTADVDLTRIGINVSEEQWYLSILTQILRGLGLSADLQGWWGEHDYLAHVQRFTDFLRQIVLEQVAGRIVVFIDEIDSTLSLDFRDDFFAGLRALHNARASDPDMARLTFVLLGVASPSDLIKDSARTPFNIGERIALNEFSKEDARVLTAGLETVYPGQGHAIFDRVFFWTNGHPYLTQKLCLSLVENPDGRWEPERIDRLVQSLFLAEEMRSESNLKFVQDRLLKHPQRRDLLKIYKQVLDGRKIADDGQSLYQNELKLSGILKAENGYLSIRNQIYRRAFGKDWVRKNFPTNWTPVIAGASIFVALLAIGVLAFNAFVQNQVTGASRQFVGEPDAGRRLDLLADIYAREAILFRQDYDDVANSLFYGLPGWPEQKALFDSVSQSTGSEAVASVVRGLYITLANVDENSRSDLVLAEMTGALQRVPQTQDTLDLLNEIRHWRSGRQYARQGDWEGAHEYYRLAIQNNPENPATRYERAKVLVQMGNFEDALSDLEQVIAFAQRSRRSGAATPTPPQAGSTSIDPSAVTSESTIAVPETQSSGTTPADTPAAAIAAATTQPPPGTPASSRITPQAVETLAVAQTPTVDSITSGFANYLQMVTQVKNLIDATPQLSDLLASAAEGQYPNLRAFLPTPAPDRSELAVSQGLVRVAGTNRETQLGENSTFAIQPGDSIQTDDEGRAVLRFPDRLEVDIFPQTEIRFAGAETGSNGATFFRLDLAGGNIRARLVSGANASLTLETDTTTLTTLERGTEFIVSHAPGVAADVVVQSGTVEMASGGESLILEAGQAVGGGGSLPATRKPTILPAASVTPAIQATLAPGVLYQDDFRQSDSGWPSVVFDNAYIGYHEPEYYHIELHAPNTAQLVPVPDLSLDDFSVEIEVFPELDLTAAEGDFHYGLFFRRSGNQYYVFAISPRTRTWSVFKRSPAAFQVLGESSHASIQGLESADVLRMEVSAENFYIYINGQLVSLVRDADYAAGELGFYVGNFDSTQAHIHFDSLVIREASPPQLRCLVTQNMIVRSGPGTDFELLFGLPSGSLFEPLGRTSDGTWIRARVRGKVENNPQGWIPNSPTFVSCDLPVDDLPVIEP